MMEVAVESYWGGGGGVSSSGGGGLGCCSSEVDVEGYQGCYLGGGEKPSSSSLGRMGARYDDGGTSGEGVSE